MKKKSPQVKWLLLLLAPFLIAGCFTLYNVVHYGVNTPFWDEWEMVSIFQKVDNHTVGFNDFWSQHNEHRIFFPNLVLTASAYVTHWNVKAELLLNFAFSLVTALMLYLFVLSKIARRYLAILAGALIAAWFFSPVQYENWLWGWQIEWFMCVAAAVTSIYLLDQLGALKNKHPQLLLGSAIASAIIATFSLGSGVLIWAVGLGILTVYKQGGKPIGIWLASAVVSIAAYYYHYHKPAGDPSTTLFLHDRTDFIRYVLSYFGRPISNEPHVAMLIGAILLLLLIPAAYMVWINKSVINKFVPWLSLMLLALMAGFLTAISRLGFGVIQGSASRYTAFSLLYIIGLTGLICALLDTTKVSRHIQVVITLVALTISIPLLFSSYANGLDGMRVETGGLRLIRACTTVANPTDGCLLLTYPRADVTRPRIDYLRAKHWAGY